MQSSMSHVHVYTCTCPNPSICWPPSQTSRIPLPTEKAAWERGYIAFCFSVASMVYPSLIPRLCTSYPCSTNCLECHLPQLCQYCKPQWWGWAESETVYTSLSHQFKIIVVVLPRDTNPMTYRNQPGHDSLPGCWNLVIGCNF